jgi:hypothetical protein
MNLKRSWSSEDIDLVQRFDVVDVDNDAANYIKEVSEDMHNEETKVKHP